MFARLVLAGSAVLLIGSLFNLTPTYCWPLEVNRNFGLYYLAAHLAVLPLLLTLSRSTMPLRVALLFALNGVLALSYALPLRPFMISAAADSSAAPGRLRVLYANVYVGNSDFSKLKSLIVEHDPDLVALLEPTVEWGQMLNLKEKYPFFKEIFNGTPFGMALYSKLPFKGEMLESLGHPLPPVIVTGLELPGGEEISVALLHTRPPVSSLNVKHNRLIIRRLAAKLRAVDQNLVVLADLNATPFSIYYQNLVEWTRVVNVMHGRRIVPTWRARSSWLFFPIDHVFVRGALRVRDARRLTDIGSDHFPLLVDLILESEQR